MGITFLHLVLGASKDFPLFRSLAGCDRRGPTGAPTTGKNGLAINFVTFPEPRTAGVRANYYF